MTKTKAQLRAEAVERLRKSDFTLDGVVQALIGWCGGSMSNVDAIIDMLTDEQQDTEVIRELRHYENDVLYDYDPIDDVFKPNERVSELCGHVADMMEGCDVECYACAKLAELRAENNALRGIVGDLKAPADPGEASMMSVDAFIEKQVEHESQDTREKLEADVRQILNSAYMFAWMHGNENRRGGSFENLHREFYNLLDRQEEITEREFIDAECMKCAKADKERESDHSEALAEKDDVIAVLKAEKAEQEDKVDELTAQLEAAYAKNRSLRTHISKMQEGRHGWHVKGVELQREVDRLTRENISLARDLGECMAERDSWRYRWHQVRVLMDEPLQCDRATLVDIDGEVVG